MARICQYLADIYTWHKIYTIIELECDFGRNDYKPLIGESMINEQEILERIENADEDELKELKLWLFRENIRIRNEKLEIKEMKERLEQDRKQQLEDQRMYLDHLSLERQQVRREEALVAEKLEVIKRGFEELDADRRRLKSFEAQLNAREVALDSKLKYAYTAESPEVADVLFKGVSNYMTLKKRYKDLMKIYHPDAMAGDNEMVLAINRVYDKMKKQYEKDKVIW